MNAIPMTGEVTVRFVEENMERATLTIQTESALYFTTILHEQSEEPRAYDTVGMDCTEPVEVADGETLTIILRSGGEIKATLLCEVDVSLAEFGLLLSPRGGFNLIMHQEKVQSFDDLHHAEVQA